MKKAFRWLDAHQIDYVFHDFKKQGLDEKTLNQWLKKTSWETLLNKRGTTFRKLPESVKNSLNHDSAKKVMLENLSIIKRPVLDVDGNISVGFDESNYQSLFS